MDSDTFENAFRRDDESDDAEFYATDRFVSHLDATALKTVEGIIGALVTDERPVILDLMASWDSHLPEPLQPGEVVGLGLNVHELEANSALSRHLVHDLNRDPVLPFADSTFHAVLCTVSVDYLTRPVEVFREVARVLRPGGIFLVIFSNRYFPPKVVKIWREADEDQRLELVTDYFRRAEGYLPPRTFVSQGKPRPADDRYAELGVPSDPVYAVFADCPGPGREATRELPHELQPRAAFTGADPVARKRWVAANLRCPHCGSDLEKWAVPQTPFTQWSSTFQYICFNDTCPHYERGWRAFARQGNAGSYRFMYDPDSRTCHSMPVPTPTAFRDSIVAREDSI